MKKIQASICIIFSAICLVLSIQPGIGAEAADITGTWKGKGVDKRGVKWELTFTLTQKDGVIEGESSWEGSDGSKATTSIRGTINIAKKTFIMKDLTLENASGDVMIGIYTGSFSDDFMKMKGKWTIPKGGSPGTFEAAKE